MERLFGILRTMAFSIDPFGVSGNPADGQPGGQKVDGETGTGGHPSETDPGQLGRRVRFGHNLDKESECKRFLDEKEGGKLQY